MHLLIIHGHVSESTIICAIESISRVSPRSYRLSREFKDVASVKFNEPKERSRDRRKGRPRRILYKVNFDFDSEYMYNISRNSICISFPSNHTVNKLYQVKVSLNLIHFNKL